MESAAVEAASERFQSVGLAPANVDLETPAGVLVYAWASRYARVYIADVSAEAGHALDWANLIARLDRKVLERIRTDEITAGGVVDAHLCFVVDDAAYPSVVNALQEGTQRHVSRKYFVKRSAGIDGIFTRLTVLAAPRLPALGSRADMGLAATEEAWLQSLLADGPAIAYETFMNRSGCET